MPNFLIIHAHHEPASFNGALTDRARAVLSRLGHSVVVSDLYNEGFDPVSDRRNFTTVKDASFLKQQREEAHASASSGFAPDVEREMQRLEWCDALIFQFPLWWFGLPAILKGWIDRVMASGRFYGGGKWYDHGAFRGKRAMISMTTGGPANMFDGWSINPPLDSILRPVQHGVFWFTGYDTLPPFIAWSASRNSDQERREYLDAYERRLVNFFTDEPLQFTRLAECDEKYRDTTPRFMAAWTWHGPDSEEVLTLIPKERALLELWRRQGILLDRWIAHDQESGWLIFRERSKAELAERLAALPLARWLTFTITELTNA